MEVNFGLSELQAKIALLWTQTNFENFLQKNPDTDFSSKKKAFLDYFEVGVSIARECA